MSEPTPAGASDADALPPFSSLPLPDPVQRALAERGYERPTPIQNAIMPHMLEGRDVIGQAQTGTGKTAAFALPLLTAIDLRIRAPQVLVLAPTRELALQVAEACQDYGKYLDGLQVAAVYGGASYGPQLRDLGRGAQVVIGTPGRVMDHLRKGSLDLRSLRCLVLDEADEMLRFGFIDDVEWILEQAPEQRQVALFSATMPPQIQRIARKHLQDPVEIAIAAKTATASTVTQSFWLVRGMPKYEAAARFIEGIDCDGVLIFTRTKAASVEVAEGLEKKGIRASALNGDMAQAQREQTVNRLKEGHLDVIVATDVAARGLDVPRISHVINYDMPTDHETYVHRIGRTGRAGRSGEAILFVHPRERRNLRMLERHTRQPLRERALPDANAINAQRVRRFAEQVRKASEGRLDEFQELVQHLVDDHDLELPAIAAALARLVHGDHPFKVHDRPVHPSAHHRPVATPHRHGEMERRHQSPRQRRLDTEHYRLAVGRRHGTRPNMIVGALANELGIPGAAIGPIRIHDSHTTVGLPADLPPTLRDRMRRIRVSGRQIGAEKMDDDRY